MVATGTFNLCSKARKLIGLIYCRFYQHSSSESLLHMYLMLVCPHQKFTLRVCSKQWNSSILQLFSLPTLQQCRFYLDLSTIFKIEHNLSYFPSGIFVEQTLRVSSTSHMSVLMHIQIHTIAPLYLLPLIGNWNLFASLVYLYHPLKVFRAYMQN